MTSHPSSFSMLVVQARDRSCVHLSPVSLFPELTAAKAGGEKTKQQQSRRKIPVSPWSAGLVPVSLDQGSSGAHFWCVYTCPTQRPYKATESLPVGMRREISIFSKKLTLAGLI